ncbi:NAD-binding protein [Myxosarcina sp. GI1]|uniref:NAD-binding protein n=1 Tax=Myxosarcina sp. GI1 TaxID=1541065 RepID=UPI0005661A1A|nr:NAD-binding protein [Myxosarcina sp. GI1]
MSTTNNTDRQNLFIVCGLQSLGQHCVAVLKDYNVKIAAIDNVETEYREVSELADLLDRLVIGDCRQPGILEQAGIRQCRSILLVTDNERINIETAFVARRLAPQVRLIVSSDRQNFNELLYENLDNFVAFEPNYLSAHAFALTALSSEAIGYFTLEGQLLRVIEHQVRSPDSWCLGKPVYKLNLTTRCILSHIPVASAPPRHFYDWNPEAEVLVGDTLIYLEVIRELTLSEQPLRTSRDRYFQWRKFFQQFRVKKLWQRTAQFWQSHYQSQNQIRRIATIYAATVLFLWFSGIFIYRFYFPGINFSEAFFATAVLLLGGYGDLFGGVKFASQLQSSELIPWWVRLFSLCLTLIGQAFVGVLYVLLTDALVTSRLQFFNPAPPIPKENHTVLVSMNHLGREVASILQELERPLVGINAATGDRNFLPNIPLIEGNITEALAKVNLAHAKSIVLLGDDNLENLEIGLMAHALNSNIPLIIRTQDRQFSDNISRLFPYAKILCDAVLSAEVFVCAAFGENVLSFFHLSDRTSQDDRIVMATEYNIEAGDTLNGLLLSKIAHGYGVVPILYQKYRQHHYSLMPWKDVELGIGDRLVVLATSDGLQRIEWGKMLPHLWQVRIEEVLSRDAFIKGVEKIVAIAECNYSEAKQWLNNVPALLPISFYQYQAQHLVRELKRVRVIADVIYLKKTSGE